MCAMSVVLYCVCSRRSSWLCLAILQFAELLSYKAIIPLFFHFSATECPSRYDSGRLI